jgi:glycosyltransferase involved in cell wall biosynthesis
MKAFDILVVPSVDEAFGRVVVEGMAAGCPVIASRVGGIPEIITQGQDGIMIPPKDTSSLVEAMLHLTRDAELRSRLTEEGRHTAQRFTAHRHASQIQAIYDDILVS